MRKLPLIMPLLAVCAGCSTTPNHYDVRSGGVHWVHSIALFEPMRSDPVPQADPPTFKQLPDSALAFDRYAADRNHAYYDGNILSGADPATFRRIKGDYWRDKTRVYYYGKSVPGAEPDSFRHLGDDWWRDNRNIYVQDKPVNPKDSGTFQILNANWAKDSKWYYPVDVGHYAPIKSLDYATFRILRDGWAVDCNRAYYFSNPVKVADIRSFRVISSIFARDNYWCYDTWWKRIPLEEAKARGIIKD